MNKYIRLGIAALFLAACTRRTEPGVIVTEGTELADGFSYVNLYLEGDLTISRITDDKTGAVCIQTIYIGYNKGGVGLACNFQGE